MPPEQDQPGRVVQPLLAEVASVEGTTGPGAVCTGCTAAGLLTEVASVEGTTGAGAVCTGCTAADLLTGAAAVEKPTRLFGKVASPRYFATISTNLTLLIGFCI